VPPPPAVVKAKPVVKHKVTKPNAVYPVATPVATVVEQPPGKAPGTRPAVPIPPPPPAGAFARPIPPGGAVVRVYEEKREEEAAPESSQASVAYRYRDHMPVGVVLYGLIVLAAFAGVSVRIGLRRRDRKLAMSALHDPATLPYRSRSRRP
jgi:hypothetical protein